MAAAADSMAAVEEDFAVAAVSPGEGAARLAAGHLADRIARRLRLALHLPRLVTRAAVSTHGPLEIRIVHLWGILGRLTRAVDAWSARTACRHWDLATPTWPRPAAGACVATRMQTSAAALIAATPR